VGQLLAPYQPPPVEDDTIQGGMDEHGMVPEIVVDLEQEVEDLNTDLLTTDRQSDSPHPTSPSQEAALDIGVAGDAPPMDVDLDVLTVVPSAQPEPPETPLHRSARRYSDRRYSKTTVYNEIHECNECISVDCGLTNLIHDRRSCVDFTLEVRRSKSEQAKCDKRLSSKCTMDLYLA